MQKMRTSGLDLWLTGLLVITQAAHWVQGANMRRSQAVDAIENHAIGCMEMRSEEGLYTFISEGMETTCGFYIIANPTQQVKLEFLEFNVDCDPAGVIATVDGWEMQGQYFPSEGDHPLPIDQRQQAFCGQQEPIAPVIANQNVMLIQALVPSRGQGYVVKVEFFENPAPCNAVTYLDRGMIRLSNRGERSNCSVSILSPQVMEVKSVDVGVTPLSPRQVTALGSMLKCEKRAKKDYVELLDGNGLDPHYMYREIDFCGLDSSPVNMRWLLGCQHSVVRLVSSGQYLNTVTIRHRPLTDLETKRAALLSC